MSTDEPSAFELEVDSRPEAAHDVRAWLASLPVDLTPDAYLLTHELVVNALSHTASTKLWVAVIDCPGGQLIQVANEGAHAPHAAEAKPFAESGRGLLWVEELSEAWGSACTDATHVWFHVPRRPAPKTRSAA